MYELVTQRTVYPSEDEQTLREYIDFHAPQLPRKVNPLIPRGLEAIILKALSKRPRDRYRSAVEMGADLTRFANGDRPIALRFAFLRQWRNAIRQRLGIRSWY